MKVVLRRTFLDLDEPVSPKSRPRASSDTMLHTRITDAEYDVASTCASGGESPRDSSDDGVCSSSSADSETTCWDDFSVDGATTSEFCESAMQSTVICSAWDAAPQTVTGVQQWESTEQHGRVHAVAQHKRPFQRNPTRVSNSSLDQCSSGPFDCRTTIMLRNLPSNFTRQALLEIFDAMGFAMVFDFVYLPIDFHTGSCLGYAFVNMVSHQHAICAMQHLHGFNQWAQRGFSRTGKGCFSQKVLEVCWSNPHQGLDTLITLYRNSRVMHRSVPDDYKPMRFDQGIRIPFPKPTKRIRAVGF